MEKKVFGIFWYLKRTKGDKIHEQMFALKDNYLNYIHLFRSLLERWTSIWRTGWCPPCCWRCCWPGRWCSTASGLCLCPRDSQRSGWVLGKPRRPVPSVGPRARELRNPLRLEWSPGLKRGFFGLDLKHGNITLGFLIKLCLCFIITLLDFKQFFKARKGKVIDSKPKLYFSFFVEIFKASTKLLRHFNF